MMLETQSLIDGVGRRERDSLDEQRAQALMAAMLEGVVAPRDVETVLRAYGAAQPSVAETIGFTRAVNSHASRLRAPADRPRSVVLPSYAATRAQPNLTALLALLLKRYGVAVLVHGLPSHTVSGSRGSDEGVTRVTTAAILHELGIAPVTDVAQAQARVARDEIACVSLDIIAPGLARMLDGARAADSAFLLTLCRLLDPFGGDGYRVIGAQSSGELARMREVLAATRANALLLHGTEGEPFADSASSGSLESFVAGISGIGATAIDAAPLTFEPDIDAPTTAAAIAEVLSGERPVPDSILAQLSCCLDGVRRG